MSLKEQLEAIWNEPGVSRHSNVCIWHKMGGEPLAYPGERRDPPLGKAAAAVKRRLTAHYGPAPMAYCGDAKLKMPDWLRENYKRNCPNNYKALIAEYGCGVTKGDRAMERYYSDLRKGKNAD